MLFRALNLSFMLLGSIWEYATSHCMDYTSSEVIWKPSQNSQQNTGDGVLF